MDTIASRPESIEWHSIEELCDRCLGDRPSPDVVRALAPLAEERPEVRDFVRRVFQLAGMSALGAENVSPFAAMGLSMCGGFLPGAWGGMVPPITRGGRHKMIDDYVERTRWQHFGPGTVMIDLGCGFPPQTAVDAAARFPAWQVIGADPVFDPYLYEDEDLYACFTRDGRLRYFWRQPTASLEAFGRRLADRVAMERQLSELFKQLVAALPSPDDGQMAVADAGGARLTRSPLRRWESSNLTFVEAGVGSQDLPTGDLIRCFNVLMYYDAASRRQFETWAASILRDGALAVTGVDAPSNSEARYEVYRKEEGTLVAREFALSPDNIRPLSIVPWFSLHDDNVDALRLATLVRIIRSDEPYRAEFDARFDDLLRLNELMVRNADGFLEWATDRSVARMVSDNSALSAQLDSDGFTQGACDILTRHGFTAWRNEAGHVSVDPAGFLNLTGKGERVWT